MRRSQGFTLIEVMITVAIVAILSAIALPAYNDYITRSRITEGLSMMSGMRVKMEQYFQDNRTYVNACAAGSIASAPSGQYFTGSCPTANLTNYVLQVQGKGVMANFTYTLNDSNQQTTQAVPSNWNMTSTCWTVKKSGECLQ